MVSNKFEKNQKVAVENGIAKMHGTITDRRALEREALKNVIAQWNANRLDIFELSEPNEDLEFHGVMRFYFQDSGQKVATKCIRVASDATVEDVIGTLVEKFRPDMRMLSVPSYALYELHEQCPERRMEPDEKPLLVQLNWHVDDREGRFLLRNIDDKTSNSVGLTDSNASFRRKLSKREKKQLKKQEKLSRMKSENGDEKRDGVAEKLYTELPETSFTRSISNPEAVMRRRRQQKLERKLQQFRSKDGGPDTGGTLKIYGEALCKDVPYKTLLLSIRDTAGSVVREMLDKYSLSRVDPLQYCLVQVTQQPGVPDVEYILDDDECPLSILMNATNTGSIMFHVRRRPADCAPRKRKKKPGALGGGGGSGGGGGTGPGNSRDPRGESVPLLIELGPDGSAPSPGDTTRTVRLGNDVMEVGSANGIALQLYGPHIQPRHCVITNTDGVTSLTPCHADAYTYVNGQRIHQTTILAHGSLVKFGHSNTYRFFDPAQDDRPRRPSINDAGGRLYDRSPRALSPIEGRENFETTFDLEGNVETVSTASGQRDQDQRSLGSSSENRLSGIDRYPRGQDPILPAVLEFPEEPQEQFLARVITHLDVTTPTFRLAPAYTLYLCARYRASTHYRPELTPTERAQKLTLLLQHAAMLVRHTIQDRSTESCSQSFWLANASELLHFLKSDRHVSAFSVSAQETLADSVQSAFKNLIACLTDELNAVMTNLMSDTADDHPREIIGVLSGAMNLLRKCRVNAALTIQLFSQLFHWISARSLSTIVNNPHLCTRAFGAKLFNRLRNLQAWAESQGLELAAECHLAKIVQCAHLLQAPKYTAEELANLSSTCFKLNSLQLRALLTQYKGEIGEQVASGPLLEQAARAAEGVADELARAEGREVRLHEDPAPPLQLLLPDDGFSCDVVQGVPSGLADFLHPLQASGLCRLAAQPTSSGHWTVYMTAPRPPSALSTTQPEVQMIRLHKAGGGMGLSIVAAKGAGQERLGIYIKSVVPGGAADRDGRLAAGDQLLSVDGQSLLGITQEKAAEFLVRTGNVVTLEVAKGGAVYHGLATLLQQPSPTPHRGPRRMSERDLPSKVDSERTIPSSKSVPALHHISPDGPTRTGIGNTNAHDVFNPGYSRTSSNNSINTNGASMPGQQQQPQQHQQQQQLLQNGPPIIGQIMAGQSMRSRSTHNLNQQQQQQQQQDSGFYQNLSVYRNKMPSPQHLGDRSSALRSSQNSLQSNTTQRPASAYYPHASQTGRPPVTNLHQSIPNLKSVPSTQRIQQQQSDETRSGSYPSVNQATYAPNPYQTYAAQNYNTMPAQQQQQQSYPSPNYRTADYNVPSTYPNYSPALHQPLHINANGQRVDDAAARYNSAGLLLREDVLRHATARSDEMMMRYPTAAGNNSVRVQEAQIQSNSRHHHHHHQQQAQHDDFERGTEMRTSKSEDALRGHHAMHNEMMRYASSGNVRAQECAKVDVPQLRGVGPESERASDAPRMTGANSAIRGTAKLMEMGEEVRRRQSRPLQQHQSYQHLPTASYYQQQQQQQPNFYPQQHYTNQTHLQNTYNLQSLNLGQQQQQQQQQQHSPYYQQQQQYGAAQKQSNYYSNTMSPNYPKSPPIAPKPLHKNEIPPELPPTSTHPLFSSTTAPTVNNNNNPEVVNKPAFAKLAKDPWAREEQERQAEVRREQARAYQDQQIRELLSIANRTTQQEEQLRVLQLEREFQRRALEAAEQDDDDTEKDSPSPNYQSATSSNAINPSGGSKELLTSILKPGGAIASANPPVAVPAAMITTAATALSTPPEPQAPPPPERGSSYAVMSMRNKETTKRVSFNDASAAAATAGTTASSGSSPTNNNAPVPPNNLQFDESVREDPNSFIRQAESMLASPTTPTDSAGMSSMMTTTPGVIGAQEVYKDPRTRRLAEQAQQQKLAAPIPEKLTFKEKMKMFAMETGESGTPKDKKT